MTRSDVGVTAAVFIVSGCGRLAPGTNRSDLPPDSGVEPMAEQATSTGGRIAPGFGYGGATQRGTGGIVSGGTTGNGGAIGSAGSSGAPVNSGGFVATGGTPVSTPDGSTNDTGTPPGSDSGGTHADAGPVSSGGATGDSGGGLVDANAGASGGDGGSAQCDADFSTNPSHCGWCHHSCGGGVCLAARCQPVVLAAQQDVPRRLALDSTNVYWINAGTYTAAYDGTINSIPKEGGVVTVLSTGLQGSNDIATDGSEVFFTDTGGCSNCVARVHKVPAAGGPTTLLATWMDGHIPFGIRVVGSYVYWTDLYSGGGLQRLPTVGGDVFDLVTGFDYAMTLTSDANHAYFTAGWSPDLVRVSLPDGPADIVTRLYGTSMSLSNTNSIAVNATHAYCFGSNGLFRVQLADGATDWISQTPGFGMAIDDQYVYTVNSLEGSIERRTLDGSSSTTMASGRTNPGDLVANQTSLYWTESESRANAGAIVKLAK